MYYKDIIFKCKNVEELHLSEKIAEICGFKWDDNILLKYDDPSKVGWIIFSIRLSDNLKCVFWQSIMTKSELINLMGLRDGYYDIVYSIDELRKLLNKTVKINYNEPRKLVYENKIIKYNEFNNGI